MQNKLALKQILRLDVKSDEFFEIYNAVVSKYWLHDLPSPDENFEFRRTLQKVADAGDDWFVDVLMRIANQIFEVAEMKQTAAHGAFEINKRKVFFDLYTDRNQLAALAEQLRNGVVVKAREEGVITDPPEPPPSNEGCEP